MAQVPWEKSAGRIISFIKQLFLSATHHQKHPRTYLILFFQSAPLTFELFLAVEVWGCPEQVSLFFVPLPAGAPEGRALVFAMLGLGAARVGGGPRVRELTWGLIGLASSGRLRSAQRISRLRNRTRGRGLLTSAQRFGMQISGKYARRKRRLDGVAGPISPQAVARRTSLPPFWAAFAPPQSCKFPRYLNGRTILGGARYCSITARQRRHLHSKRLQLRTSPARALARDRQTGRGGSSAPERYP